jgi:PAS domain S-box-containing protein
VQHIPEEIGGMTTEPTPTAGASFAQLFDGMPAPALILDPADGAIRAANAAAADMLGYPQDDLQGMTAGDIHPHELPRLREFFEEIVRHGTWQRDDLSCRTRDGVFVPAEIRSKALTHDGQRALLVLIRDLRGEQLAEVGQSVRKLVHDLRNALSTAQLLSDRLQGHEDPNVRNGADVMSRSLERALDLCQQTIRAGRAQEQRPDPTRFLLDDVIDELMATAVLPSGLGAQIAFDPADSAALDADYDQLYRILLNLVRNASDAGAQRVTIRGRRTDGGAVITVADDGPGLPDTILASLDQEKDSPGGSSGLGLMIAAELARGHGGALSVEQTGPEGTTFRLVVPDQG